MRELSVWPKPLEDLQREPIEEKPRAGEENQAKPEVGGVAELTGRVEKAGQK